MKTSLPIEEFDAEYKVYDTDRGEHVAVPCRVVGLIFDGAFDAEFAVIIEDADGAMHAEAVPEVRRLN